jgi:hypothetical protein
LVRADVTWYARRLALDLGAKAADDPIEFILGHAGRKVRAAASKRHANTLADLLAATAQEVRTRFEVIETDEQLDRLVKASCERGETGFAALPKDFEDSYGVTLRLLKPREWELEHVSVIDTRGSKVHKSYFTKWHELAHLLVLTDQAQLKFRRTHAERQAPDEALMELIAAHFGYWSDILQPHLKGELTFETLNRIRAERCPEGSWQSFVHAAIDRWPKPAAYIKAELRLKRAEERQLNQMQIWDNQADFKLRISDVVVNSSARSRGADLFPNMRVPEQSILNRTHAQKQDGGVANECLSMWESSDRGALPACEIVVVARPAYESVEGLVTFD